MSQHVRRDATDPGGLPVAAQVGVEGGIGDGEDPIMDGQLWPSGGPLRGADGLKRRPGQFSATDTATLRPNGVPDRFSCLRVDDTQVHQLASP